jgi:aminomethyltransferase
MVAFDMQDKAIPRPHFPVRVNGERVGELTSGTFSPTFGHGIGLGYVHTQVAKPGTEAEIEVRQTYHPAWIVRKPMYKREG